MICDCQRNFFDCEEKVRCFLGIDGETGSLDLTARNELIARMTPLIEKIVSSKLQGKWQQDRANVVQETLLKLCDPAKIRTWLESPKRTWFCHWAVVVAYHCAIDWIRGSDLVFSGVADLTNKPDNPRTSLEIQEQAERLRETINSALSDFDIKWQLVFCMKYSYLKPSVSDIASAASVSEETVFFRLHKIRESIIRKCAPLLSPEVSKVALVGNRHPVDGFERFDSSKQQQINSRINKVLNNRPLPEQFAFYMKYSPLALDITCIASRVGEDQETVSHWLEKIESQIKRFDLPDVA